MSQFMPSQNFIPRASQSICPHYILHKLACKSSIFNSSGSEDSFAEKKSMMEPSSVEGAQPRLQGHEIEHANDTVETDQFLSDDSE
jgi:hypothetical protein